jgi:N-methylhydantoinase B/oxoprolinase/acetone carboxylase alpha subunit
VRNLLRRVANERGTELHAIDYLDDGTPIELHVSIDKEKGSAVFDFEGTGPEMIGLYRDRM